MKDPAFAKFVLLVNGSVPLALLCWDCYRNPLIVNPVDYAINTTGSLALLFLILSLTITPLRKISGKNWLSHFRRMLGLYAFFYGALHFLIYFFFDRSGNLGSAITDVLKRRFILFGFTALVLMVPLAITSTNGMIKRLGAAKWKRLHQLVYVSAAAGVLHYYERVKADHTKPVVYIVILFVLLGYRILVNQFPNLKYKPAPRL